MTLDELIRTIPKDHYDREILVKDDSGLLHKVQFTHIIKYGFDVAKIVLRLDE